MDWTDCLKNNLDLPSIAGRLEKQAFTTPGCRRSDGIIIFSLDTFGHFYSCTTAKNRESGYTGQQCLAKNNKEQENICTKTF